MTAPRAAPVPPPAAPPPAEPPTAHQPLPSPSPSPTLRPFSDTAPLLPEVYPLALSRPLRAPPRDRPRLVAALAALDDFITRPAQHASDPLALPTGRWLKANLLLRLERAPEAIALLTATVAARGPFADDAALRLADLAAARDPEARAEWLLARRPGAPAYLRGVDEALAIFRQRGDAARGAALLEASLGQALNPDLRTALLLRVAEAHIAAGAPQRARSLLLRHYWARRDALPEALRDALRRLEATPDAVTELMRDALHGTRATCERLAERLVGLPADSAPHLRLAAEALSLRWRDPQAALALLDAGAEPVASLAFEPGLARAMVLRRLERDEEAARMLTSLIEREPAHLLAAEARDQASIILRGLERFAEADAMDEDLLALADAGPFHRDALWRLGFGAVLRVERTIAERWLRELEGRYGAEPDRHSFTWAERARYWRATAAEPRTRRDAGLAELLARYPAGWYGLLARQRLGRSDEAVSETEASWVVSPEDPMATALSLWKLGAEREAQVRLEGLMAAHLLPQPGRRLLADLLIVAGEDRQAERVLRFASIPATMPGEDDADLFRGWYPMPHADALVAAAGEAALSPDLLAGLVSVESRYNADAVSAVGAMGLAQLMPATGEQLGRRLYGPSFERSSLFDPTVNLRLAGRYLGELLKRFGGHHALAAAAYNAGPTPVRRWLAARGHLGLDAWVETIPYEEARRYVMRVLADAELYRRLYQLAEAPLALPQALPR